MEKSVALVLSSGGSRGVAQIGVINELVRQGFQITSVAGSSIGAVIGGLYAMGKMHEYAEWVSTFKKRDVLGFMDFTLTTQGLLKGERVFEKMKTIIPDMNIEDMPIPFSAVATDIINEKPFVFTKGSYYEAIRASVAIPAIITPVNYGNTILVDGGVLNPIPIEYVSRKSGDILVVVNLYGKKVKLPPNEDEAMKGYVSTFVKSLNNLISTRDRQSMGYYSLLSNTTTAMVKRIAEMSIEKHTPDIVIDIPHNFANTFDFYKAKELIELGQKAANEAIVKFKENVR